MYDDESVARYDCEATGGTIISRSAGKTLKRGIGAYKILMTIRKGRGYGRNDMRL